MSNIGSLFLTFLLRPSLAEPRSFYSVFVVSCLVVDKSLQRGKGGSLGEGGSLEGGNLEGGSPEVEVVQGIAQ